MVSTTHLPFRLGSDAFAVQHYALADRIVILGDSRIQLEGAPDDLLHSSSQILKTILHDKEKANRQLDEPKTQQIPKSSSTDTAALNLTRRTGDLALYGIAEV
jgi:ATP-binding cassette subfamily C (CFTR/MRP) protein 1